jgi:Tfp pilus assembly PilM family ATPase
LANTKDINNSTERLLNVIRGSKRPLPAATAGAQGISPRQKKSDKISVNLPRKFAGKHRFKVGVDIGQDVITFAKMTKTSDGRPLLVDQKIVKFDRKIAKGSGEFKDLLKSSINAFAGSLDDCDIWATMDATEVNVHHLKIPHVPKKQLGNVIYWAAKKENPIDEKNVVFDYEMQGEVNDQGIPKHFVMVYTAPRAEVAKVKNIFSSIGINLAGITTPSFAIQNIFRTEWIAVGESTFASIFIGDDFSRIDIYRKSNLVMTRGIKTGISSMMEAIDESIAETQPDQRVDKESVKKILNDLSADPEKWLKDEDGINWTESGILEMITPALERLIRQIERTLGYYATSVGYEKVEKVYISSVMSVFYYPLLNYISKQLGTKSEFFDPYQGQNASASGASLSLAERTSLIPVIGLALSDRKHTPNAIFTYVQKKQEIRTKMINSGIFATFATALFLCIVLLVFQAMEAKHLGIMKGKLERELLLFNPILSKDKIDGLATDMKIRHQHKQQYSQKYKGMALISELSFLTPDNIRLINVRITMPAGDTARKDAVKKEKDEGVSIQGVVLGTRSTLDVLLAQYVIKLENSPMLQGVSLKKSSIVNFKKNEILQFVIDAKIG